MDNIYYYYQRRKGGLWSVRLLSPDIDFASIHPIPQPQLHLLSTPQTCNFTLGILAFNPATP